MMSSQQSRESSDQPDLNVMERNCKCSELVVSSVKPAVLCLVLQEVLLILVRWANEIC